MRNFFSLFIVAASLFISGCGVAGKIKKSAWEDVLNTEALKTAHVGISIYEPAAGKYWFNYQGDKYFVPASNTKIPTCYAAMKYLGDSLVGLRYSAYENATGIKTIYLEPTGDPTFLHPEFLRQSVFSFLKSDTSAHYMVSHDNWKEQSLGAGWSWNDYAESYMAERSHFPIYGNVIRFYGKDTGFSVKPSTIHMEYGGEGDDISPINFKSALYSFTRKKDQNVFLWDYAKTPFRLLEIPFVTSTSQTIRWLKDTLGRLRMFLYNEPFAPTNIIHSQPTDSLLRLMMHRSDNFFAEQSLLMVSNELLGFMNDERIIDTLLKTDFKDLPQKPRWVDGSGLSRYNLFTPQDLVFILNKMRNEFGMPRIKNILATGGEGTLSNYYQKEKGFLYAKTGSLSGVVALSGFLTTKKGKELIFSVQVNNHNGSATDVRRAVEKFVEGIRKNF